MTTSLKEGAHQGCCLLKCQHGYQGQGGKPRPRPRPTAGVYPGRYTPTARMERIFEDVADLTMETYMKGAHQGCYPHVGPHGYQSQGGMPRPRPPTTAGVYP